MRKNTVKRHFSVSMWLAVICMIVFAMCCSTSAASNSARARKILRTMTWKEKIAQMFVVAVPFDAAEEVQKEYQFGGYVFFENDFRNSTPRRMKNKIKKIQKESKINMLIAVDEEGGTVNRVSKFSAFRSKAFESPQTVYRKSGWRGVKRDTAAKAKFLKNIGINTNFAPVADTPYRSSDFIYRRSFSTNVSAVSKYIKTVVGEMKANNLVSTLKHFPGYGGNGDTHTLIVRDKRSKKTFTSRDLKPFAAGIRAGCDMIMVSHNIVNCFDKSAPASLSGKVHKYLRSQMKFDGVIITDEISMTGAAAFAGSSSKAAVKAIQAGNDMICTTQYKEQFNAVYKAFKQGTISKSQINESVKRILIMKFDRGIIR